MTKDTIFNIASMTKPMVALAALQLQERGQLLIDDPLSKYFPKYAQMEVAELQRQRRYDHRQGAGQAADHAAASDDAYVRPDLRRHAATPLCTSFIRAAAATAGATMSGAEFMDDLAKLPLLNHPGAVWDYGFGLDVLGLVVEKVSGQKLERILRAEHSQSRSA